MLNNDYKTFLLKNKMMLCSQLPSSILEVIESDLKVVDEKKDDQTTFVLTADVHARALTSK